MATTLFLDPETWDLRLDIYGNIALATQEYQQAQDISSACRTMQKDMYYQQDKGIPYLEEILGTNTYSLALYQQQLRDCALSVDGVYSATVSLNLQDRGVGGSLTFTNTENKTMSIGL